MLELARRFLLPTASQSPAHSQSLDRSSLADAGATPLGPLCFLSVGGSDAPPPICLIQGGTSSLPFQLPLGH